MVRRWGWLAGIYLALQGAGVTLVGLIARWGFGSMFAASNQMMSGFGMGGGWAYDGPPEMESAVMEALGVAPQVSPMSYYIWNIYLKQTPPSAIACARSATRPA